MKSIDLLDKNYRRRLHMLLGHTATNDPNTKAFWNNVWTRIENHITSENRSLVCAFNLVYSDYLVDANVTVRPLSNGTDHHFLININLAELVLVNMDEDGSEYEMVDLTIPLNIDDGCNNDDEMDVLLHSLVENIAGARNRINDVIIVSINSYTLSADSAASDIINITIRYDVVPE